MITPALNDQERPDDNHAVYFNIFYQGISNLLPWNVLIFAYDYFEFRLRSVPEASDFILHFVLIFMTMKFVFLISGVTVTTKIRPDQQISWSIVANVLVFCSITFVCAFDLLSQKAYYYVIMALVILAALFSAFIEAGFLIILTHFPAKYTQSYLVGHGFAGVVSALLHLSSALGTASASSNSFARIYFGITACIMLISGVLFRYMTKLEMFDFYFQKGISLTNAKHEAKRLEEETGLKAASSTSPTKQVLGEIFDLFATVFLITCLNVLVSPMIIMMTEPTTEKGQSVFGKSVFHVLALLLSSIFDLVGKCIPAVSTFAIKSMSFLPLAALRLLILPALLIGNISIFGYKLPFEPLYRSDVIFFILIAVKEITGGYLGTLCMMWSSSRVKSADRSKAVTLMVYAIGIALLVGAISAYILKRSLVLISLKQ